MKPVLTADMMKACDSACIASGTPSETLMERAADALPRLWHGHDGGDAPACGMVCIVQSHWQQAYCHGTLRHLPHAEGRPQ